MLPIEIPDSEMWDPNYVNEKGEKIGRFIPVKATVLNLEHSLVSISKWEAKWHKPFLNGEKNTEETLDYIRCMTITQNVDPNVYQCLTRENIEKITKYIEDPATATVFKETRNSPKSREIITSEIIYYWMISYNIPVEICQKWHLNRLLALIRVFNIKNAPPKKRSQSEIIRDYAHINEMNRKRFNSKG